MKRIIEYITDATRQQREQITSWAKKSGKDPEKVLDFVELFAEGNAQQVAFAKWYCADYDRSTYEQAYNICSIKKLNPLTQNPEELVRNNADVGVDSRGDYENAVNILIKGKERIEEENGAYSYEVRDEDMQKARDVINAYFGKDSNTWCLMHAEDGVIDAMGRQMWLHYSKHPKRIVFYKGNLLAFSAGKKDYREYWDRWDRSFAFPPVEGVTWEANDRIYKILKGGDVVFTEKNGGKYILNKEYSDDVNDPYTLDSSPIFDKDFVEGNVTWEGLPYHAKRIGKNQVVISGSTPTGYSEDITLTDKGVRHGLTKRVNDESGEWVEMTFANGKMRELKSFKANGVMSVKRTALSNKGLESSPRCARREVYYNDKSIMVAEYNDNAEVVKNMIFNDGRPANDGAREYIDNGGSLEDLL